jgi:hypothetical protein
MKDIQNLKRMAAVMTALAMVVLTVTGCSKSAANEDGAQSTKTEIAGNGLAAPDGIETSAIDGLVTVTWNSVDGAFKYDVYGAGVHAVTVDTSYTFNSLAPGEYSVAVRAFGGSRSSEASKVTFVLADGGSVETTAVDVPELKATSKSDSKTDSKKAESTTTTDKAKASTGNSNSSSGNKNSNTSTGNSNTSSGNKDTGNTDASKNIGNGNSNSNTGNGNNANTGNNGSGTNTGSGATTPKPPADPNAGKVWVPEQQIWHEPTYKTVRHEEWGVVGIEEGMQCNYCDFTLWGYGRFPEMSTHMKENRHGAYHNVIRDIEGWQYWDEQVVDVAGWFETIPGHYE